MQNGMYDSDDDLATSAAKGDEGSAVRLYERYTDRVYRIAYRIVLEEGLSKDVAQETWMKAFRNLHRFALGSSFGAWVSSIAVRTAIDALRKQKRTIQTEPVDDAFPHPFSNEPSAHERLTELEIEREVTSVLNGLSDAQRAAFIMRHFEGSTLREIGETLGCSEGTVKAHVYRAANAVRNHLAKWLNPKVEKS